VKIYITVVTLRRFKRRLFERKGQKKEVGKDEKLLKQNVEDLKNEALRKGGEKDFKKFAKDLLKEED
jgi:hypothetical protein